MWYKSFMKNRNLVRVALIIVGLALGLIAGYFVFGTIAGRSVSVETLLTFGGGRLRDFAESSLGVKEMRRNILLTGLGGGILGGIGSAFIGNAKSKKRRKKK